MRNIRATEPTTVPLSHTNTHRQHQHSERRHPSRYDPPARIGLAVDVVVVIIINIIIIMIRATGGAPPSPPCNRDVYVRHYCQRARDGDDETLRFNAGRWLCARLWRLASVEGRKCGGKVFTPKRTRVTYRHKCVTQHTHKHTRCLSARCACIRYIEYRAIVLVHTRPSGR